jgi:hypothetical protein
MDRMIDLFGFSFYCTFSPHALRRCRERNILPDIVPTIISNAEEELGDNAKDEKEFVIRDWTTNIAVVGVFNFRADTVTVKTVINKAEAYCHPGDTVFDILPDGKIVVDNPGKNKYNKKVKII